MLKTFFNSFAEEATLVFRTCRDLPSTIPGFVEKKRNFLIFAFACILIAWGYELFNFTMSPDDEFFIAGTTSDNRLQWIRQDRWGMWIISSIFYLGNPFLDFFITLSGMTLAFLILFGDKEQKYLYALYPVFIASPVFYYATTFTSLNPGLGFSLAAITLAGRAYRKCPVVSIVLCGFAIGCYQATIVYFPLIVIFDLFNDWTDKKNCLKKTALYIVKSIAVLVLAYVFFKLVSKSALWLINDNVYYIDKFVKNTVDFGIFKEAFSQISGMNDSPDGIWIKKAYMQMVLWFVILTAFLVRFLTKREYCAGVLTLITSVILLLISFSIFAFLSVPFRGYLGVPVAFVMIIYLFARYVKIYKIIAVILACLFVQYAVQDNSMAWLNKVQEMRTQYLLSDIMARVYSIPEAAHKMSIGEKVPFFMLGSPNIKPLPGAKHAVGEGVLFFAGGQPHRYVRILDRLTTARFSLPAEEEYDKIADFAETMPVWPADGSVAYHAGGVIVKFSGGHVFRSKGSKRKMTYLSNQWAGVQERTACLPKKICCMFQMGNADKSAKNMKFRAFMKTYFETDKFLFLAPDKKYAVAFSIDCTEDDSMTVALPNNGADRITMVFAVSKGENKFAFEVPGSILSHGLAFSSGKTSQNVTIKSIKVLEDEK